MNSVMMLLGSLVLATASAAAPKPHILMVIVDDFGWADAGWHRETPTPEVVTPTMDKLVQEGVELNRHYVHMMCTPTRSSFYSGRLPIHVLTQLSSPCDTNGAIPRNITGVAAQLKKGGYATHHVGKWDAGMATPHHTPQGRGYDTSLNYFGHGNWMYSEREWLGSYHNRSTVPGPDEEPNGTIVDFWDTDKPASTLNGTGYEEYVFRDRILSILNDHDKDTPLFLTYASKIVHYPQQAPVEYQEKFSFITDVDNRRMYHAMVNFLDDQLANITTTMKNLGMWDNTLMVLTSDNGGYVGSNDGGCNASGPDGMAGTDWGHGTSCFNGEAGANNYPLRGGKYAMWEGGIRVNAFVSGGFLPQSVRGTKLDGPNAMIHITDWYVTFAKLATGEMPTDQWAADSNLPAIDGHDVWPLVSGQNKTSPRTTIVVNAQLLVHNEWKYVKSGSNMIEAQWEGPQYPNGSTLADNTWVANYHYQCSNKDGCLWNVVEDMTEQTEVSAANPEVVAAMKNIMASEAATIFSVSHANDPACKPYCHANYGGFYGPWKEV
eukprot:m.179651 g.179651  ORF g.179651 m.179651 type:complete len:548 (-) comp14819_c0_seq1:100-1743(-)